MRSASRSGLRELKGKKVVVTGAAGFIGFHVVRKLIALGCKVSGWVRPGSEFSRPIKNLKISIERIDLAETWKVTKLLERINPDVVLHIAALGGDGRGHDSEEYVRQNVLPSISLFEASKKLGFRLVVAGTMSELESRKSSQDESANLFPVNDYGWSKVAALQYFQLPTHSSENWIWLRLFGVYGPWEASWRIFPSVISAMIKNESVPLSSCRIIRDFVFIDDVVDAFCLAAISSSQNEVINIGSGRGHCLRDTLEVFAKEHGKPHLLKFGGRPDRKFEAACYISNSRKAQNSLGWKAKHSIDQGLRMYFNWCLTSEARKFLKTKAKKP